MHISLLLAGCASSPPPDLRDLRPTRLERGEVITVEAGRDLFVPDAMTEVRLRQAGGDALLVAPGRAVSPTRVLFTVDENLLHQIKEPLRAPFVVTVRQVADGQAIVVRSPERAPFILDVAPANLRSLAVSTAERARGVPAWLVLALFMLGAAVLVSLPIPVIGGLIVTWERKISAWMQARIGPNRVGPAGWLQWLADGIKLLLKEDLVPADADPHLFKAAPILAFVALFVALLVIPFSTRLIVADLDVGILFILSITSLVVVSIILGGWSSNSKWSLLGGMRSAAQIVSYELPAAMALLSVAATVGSLSTQAAVRAQGGWPWQWLMFRSPLLYFAFFIYFISALAEGNRTPFDLPEAESELVAGYNTEYSGFRFALFPLVEWVNLFFIGAVGGMLFCGGWQLPLISPEQQEAHLALQVLGGLCYLVKITGFVFVIIWIRWTLPRFRVDQMMNLCWKYLLPGSILCFLGTLAWEWLLPSPARLPLALACFAVGGLLPFWLFVRRVLLSRTRFRALTLNPVFAPREPKR